MAAAYSDLNQVRGLERVVVEEASTVWSWNVLASPCRWFPTEVAVKGLKQRPKGITIGDKYPQIIQGNNGGSKGVGQVGRAVTAQSTNLYSGSVHCLADHASLEQKISVIRMQNVGTRPAARNERIKNQS